jgi:hypothetical protein
VSFGIAIIQDALRLTFKLSSILQRLLRGLALDGGDSRSFFGSFYTLKFYDCLVKVTEREKSRAIVINREEIRRITTKYE